MSSNDALLTSLRTSYATSEAGPSNGVHAGSPMLIGDGKTGSFTTDDDEDHEYQVIPDNLPTPTPTRSTK
uniref:Uncharacterized protein n=1 Tax=Ciona savignyi TaxID=51511 RepID=H2Y4J9_CIOSA